MANPRTPQTQTTLPSADIKAEIKALMMKGALINAKTAEDGTISVKGALSALKVVDVADVDLLLTFANGDHVIITNGALDALSATPPDTAFTDQKINLSDLFKMVGLTNPAKMGSLRLVSENIDANPPPEEERVTQSEQVTNTPAPPAPMVKVSVGTSSTGAGKGPGNGVGAGEGEGEIPAMVVPLTTAQPSTYRVGRPSQSVQDLLDGTGLGIPNVTSALYTAPQFKVTPSGRSDLPLGAYDANASSDQLAARASPAGQSTREVMNGTGGNDTIDFNPAFSTGTGQWSKTLHITLNNFSEVNSIQLVFNAAKIAQIPGFNLVGTGVTRDGPTSNSWHVTPDAAMLLAGLDVNIVYNVNDSAAPVDFGADVIVNGRAGPFDFQVVNNLNLTWRDAVTQADFTVTSSTGDPLMVLPRAGVGVEIFAGNGNDVINAGAGPDLIHGGDGDDTINAGTGNDTLDGGVGSDTMDGGQGIDAATYENATSGVFASLDTFYRPLNTGEALNDAYNNIENLTGSNFNDILIGDAQANVLKGGQGDDKLIGRGNSDTLDGGSGVDTASYEYATASVIVNLTTNTGSLGEADGDTLVSIENLIGGAADDTFISGQGVQANSYDGRTGSDTVSYEASTAPSGVVASLTTGLSGVVQTNEAVGDTFTDIENLVGSTYADRLIGNAANNILDGGLGNGNDVLEGLGGADTFKGGGGTDTVSYEHSTAGVTSSLSTIFAVGPAVVQAGDAAGDTYISVENMLGSSFNDTLIGDNLSNVINGGDGDDIIEGMGGDDTINGGNGNDTASYAHATTGVAASLTTGLSGHIPGGDAASDTFISIENLSGSNFNDTLIGNADANVLLGGDGDDVLEGMAGGDTLNGGAGVNAASYAYSADAGGGLGVTASLINSASNTGDAANDVYVNIQNLTGSAFNDTLTGDAANNNISGGAGDDVIVGGLGVDQLLGGIGNDSLSDDGVGAAVMQGGTGNDTITFTNYDGVVDSVDGGADVDTLVINWAGSNYWNFDMKAAATQTGGTIQNNWGAVWGNFNGVENITVTGSNYLYVYVGNGDNVITGGSTVNDYVDYRYAVAGINANLATGVVTGGSGNDTLVNIEHLYGGSAFDDVLIGNDANNWIRGGSGGSDVIDGGNGRDTWYIDWNGAAVTASLLTAAQNAAMGIVMTGDAAGDTVTNMEIIYSYYSNFLYGDAIANDLYGNGLIEGFAGADYLYGWLNTATASYANAGNAYLAGLGITTGAGVGVTATLTTSFSVGPAVTNTGDAAGDTYNNVLNNLQGSAFDDVLIGNNAVNNINGGAGNDTLEGLGGADTFNGGAGVDTVSYAHSTAGVTADLSLTATGTNDANGDIFIGIENLIGTNFNDNLTGNGNDNKLDGGTGTNVLNGEGGIDTASYENATAAVTINLGANTVSGAGRNDTLINIERIIGSKFADTITGSAGNDWIDGGSGSGGSDADNIDALGGIDTISYLSATSGRTVVLNASSSDGKILSNFENIYGSTHGDSLTGDTGNNVIEGGVGDDTLNGGAGAGVDTVSYQYSTAAVSVNISGSVVLGVNANSASGGEGNDVLSNFDNITGSTYNDILIGDGNDNVIDGGDGNDLLVGGAGADNLIGGNGTDTVSYTNALSAVAVTISGTGTLGDANGDTLVGVENLIGSGFNDTLTGDNSNNLIDGGAGDDTINGSGGVDTVTYLTAASAVTVNLSNAGINATGGAGSDTLTNFENIIGSIYNDTLRGDGGSNTIEGGLGNDILSGAGGVDTVSYENAAAAVSVNISATTLRGVAGNSASGGAGNDTLEVSGPSNTFENILGSTFNDILIGDLNVNTLDGGAGDDVLIGGAGADTLIGGLGIDTVSYENATSSVRATLGGSALTHLGDAVGDSFSGIENLVGSTLNDILYGDASNNNINGGLGNDDLRGFDGNDTIDATQGLDLAYGGNGDDLILVSVSSIGGAAHYFGEGNTATNYGGGDTIKLIGLGASYSLTTLANETDSMEILNIRDGVNTNLGVVSLDVRNFVDGGNASNIWIKADAGDTINLGSLAPGETYREFNVAGGKDYVIYDATNTQVAAIHWQTA